MVVTTRGISAMRLEEVDAKLQELGWRPDDGVKLTLLEKKSILHELLQKLPVVGQKPGQQQDGHRNLAKKSKEDLRQICTELKIPSRATGRSRR